MIHQRQPHRPAVADCRHREYPLKPPRTEGPSASEFCPSIGRFTPAEAVASAVVVDDSPQELGRSATGWLAGCLDRPASPLPSDDEVDGNCGRNKDDCDLP